RLAGTSRRRPNFAARWSGVVPDALRPSQRSGARAGGASWASVPARTAACRSGSSIALPERKSPRPGTSKQNPVVVILTGLGFQFAYRPARPSIARMASSDSKPSLPEGPKKDPVLLVDDEKPLLDVFTTALSPLFD